MDDETILGKKEDVKEILKKLGIKEGDKPVEVQLPKIETEEDQLEELSGKYIKGAITYANNGRLALSSEEEKFMQAIETKMGIYHPFVGNIRKDFADCVKSMEELGRKFTYNSNPHFHNALRAYLKEEKEGN